VPFEEFRERFRACLTATNVVRDALGRLTSHPREDVRSNSQPESLLRGGVRSLNFLDDRRLADQLSTLEHLDAGHKHHAAGEPEALRQEPGSSYLSIRRRWRRTMQRVAYSCGPEQRHP
jgi:hypothetical protein